MSVLWAICKKSSGLSSDGYKFDGFEDYEWSRLDGIFCHYKASDVCSAQSSMSLKTCSCNGVYSYLRNLVNAVDSVDESEMV